MPADSAAIEIEAAPEAVFDLLHDYSQRLEWDPFLREARLLDGALHAALGVTTRCVARRRAGGLAMDTVYVSFARPSVAAVKMTQGPRLFHSFAASIRQARVGSSKTRVLYRYNFELRPPWLAPLLTPFVRWAFHRQTRRRLEALKRFLERQSVVEMTN